MKNFLTPHAPSSKRSGFTLIEVLVSSALTLLIMSMLFTVLIGAMNAWQAGTGRLQGNADARMALDIIASDLQSMVVRQTTYNQEWLYSNEIPIDGAQGRNSTWLTFFAPSLDRTPGQEGDIIAISYRVGYQDPLSGSNEPKYKIFGLYKHMIDTRNTFQHALGIPNTRDAFWVPDIMDTNLNPSPANPAAPGTREALDRRSLLIPNVVDFSIRWHLRSGNVVNVLDAQHDTVRLTNTFSYGSGNSLAEAPGVLIEYADISITILTDEGAGRVQTHATGGNLDARLNSIIQEFGRVYTKRVQIQY